MATVTHRQGFKQVGSSRHTAIWAGDDGSYRVLQGGAGPIESVTVKTLDDARACANAWEQWLASKAS